MAGRLVNALGSSALAAEAFSDLATLRHMLRFEAALAQAAAEAGLIPKRAAPVIVKACDPALYDPMALADAARKDRDIDVRRLQAANPSAMGPRHATGLHRREAAGAIGEGSGAAVSFEAGVERQVAAVVGMVVAAMAVGLPDLEDAVGHDGAVDVVQLQDDLDAFAGHAGRREIGAVGAAQGAPVEGADGLRRRESV